MAILFQSHGGPQKPKTRSGVATRAAPPAGGEIAVDEQADFGYFFPPSANAADYLPEGAQTIADLDRLGDLMIEVVPENAGPDAPPKDSTLPPVLTYWGQFLDHELTARTDRESTVTNIAQPDPPAAAATVEAELKNARTPRFDLDSVYGGLPIGPGIGADVATLINGLRHPTLKDKMRVGTAVEPGPLPDTLDEHRDLPRYGQVQASLRKAALDMARASMTPEKFAEFEAGLPIRALIGDQRNDENLIVAQFHLSFLRFHNKAVDFLASKKTGWPADFQSAQTLTRLHYQWLIVEGYLKGVCDPAVVDAIVADRASHFFRFRSEFDARRPAQRLGNAIPIEFSTAAYRFGHSMVRAVYDHNNTFGRPNGTADFFLLFAFTGNGGAPNPALPKNWVIDWNRFLGTAPLDHTDGFPARFARRIDTELAPPLKEMGNEGNDQTDPGLMEMFKQLARRNLRRGYNLRLPTGQAIHAYLKAKGAVQSNPIADISTAVAGRPDLAAFLAGSASQLHQRTPLWFYCLAEAEHGGGNRLGEVGSWLVASTFVGVLLADPDSALSRGFHPSQSPLKAPDGTAIDSIVKWMKFAAVMR